jgi:phage baseplate assembly protein W
MPIVGLNPSTVGSRYSDHWAYDISENVISKGEIHDDDVIRQSIELILATMFRERLFNPGFGSVLGGALWDTMDENSGEMLLDSVLDSIAKIEDRIVINNNRCRMNILPDDHAIILTIQYTIRATGLPSRFAKRITL